MIIICYFHHFYFYLPPFSLKKYLLELVMGSIFLLDSNIKYVLSVAYVQTTRALMIIGSILGLPVVAMLLVSMPCISFGNEPQASKNKRTILGGVLMLIVGKWCNFTSLHFTSHNVTIMIEWTKIKCHGRTKIVFALTCPHQDPLQARCLWPLLTPTQMLTSRWEQRMLNRAAFLPRVRTYAHSCMFLFHSTLPCRSHRIPLLHLLSSTPCLCPAPHGKSHPEMPSLLRL